MSGYGRKVLIRKPFFILSYNRLFVFPTNAINIAPYFIMMLVRYSYL